MRIYTLLCIFPLLLLTSFSKVCNAENNTCSTVWIPGHAPIRIDGNLSDWKKIKAGRFPIEQFNTYFRSGTPSKKDLSAYLRCFADEHCVYVAVEVTDDRFVYGEEMFSELQKGMRDDDYIEIYFDGDLKDVSLKNFDRNDGQITFTLDENKNVVIGGISHFRRKAFPYMWEALGVRGFVKKHRKGYVVEAAIPFSVLGWDTMENGRKMGMNLRIFDDDDGLDFDHMLDWETDTFITKTYSTTEGYRQIVFEKKQNIKIPKKYRPEPQLPLQAQISTTIYSVLDDLSNYKQKKPYRNSNHIKTSRGRFHSLVMCN